MREAHTALTEWGSGAQPRRLAQISCIKAHFLSETLSKTRLQTPSSSPIQSTASCTTPGLLIPLADRPAHWELLKRVPLVAEEAQAWHQGSPSLTSPSVAAAAADGPRCCCLARSSASSVAFSKTATVRAVLMNAPSCSCIAAPSSRAANFCPSASVASLPYSS